ncbi:UNVERIFIED_ORG: hypothetical protein J2Y77_004710 [Pseudomonas lini]|uniref:Uncharacterized protein n=1 Tax=Pseudomonas viciae TaxID=2505979 RepID=A0ABY8PDW7_9PSED|nr:hypothetical protein [Pseudomonas viciae]UZE86397.1 hypothetical protein LOY66_28400 [Pseudomonas viciae]WGO93372.1 hypothetical protein QCD61_27470 [Pseudomonas viciae]
MFKPTPNPPEADQAPPRTKSKTQKLDEAANRALDFYLSPKTKPEDTTQPGQIFTVVKDIDNESLLAFELEGSRRHIALGIQQLIELSSLLANRALDNVDLR